MSTARAAAVGAAVALWVLGSTSSAVAQQQQGQMPQQRGGGQTMAADDYTGFRAIFDGRTLDGWDGDPMFWSVQDGVIVAESTPERVVIENTFLIWRGGTPADFELKVDVRFAGDAGNSGIQVRSRPNTAPTSRTGGEERRWGIAGYQVDVTPRAQGSALLFEEGGRGFLARQGQITRRVRDDEGNATTLLVGQLGEAIVDHINPPGEWNSFHIIARGNQLTVLVNGRLSAMTIDDDPEALARDGLIALQMHTGSPFRVEFRNVYLKEL
ncbi:MAG TPA: DUF1080 domain-containing protein [Longimicrobiales bacterium]|nr:DUF1080 domain-containing protein [Longimicrobiales bacterium]